MSNSYTIHHLTSHDDGKTYQLEHEEILFGTFFFLSNSRTLHKRNLYDIVRFLADLGGLQAILLTFIGTVGGYINTKIFMSRMMREL